MKRDQQRLLFFISFVFLAVILCTSWIYLYRAGSAGLTIRLREYVSRSSRNLRDREGSVFNPGLTRDVAVEIPVKTEIMKALFSPLETHYDENYWNFQRPMGELGGVLEQWKFRDLIPPGSNCFDFGAGGGFLLHGLAKCAGKSGLELNPHAIAHAKKEFDITLHNNTESIPDGWADVIISNHALEHVLCPWCELSRLRSKLKRGTGKLIFVVPAAGRNDAWTNTPDVNFHVYTWSPQTLGNLVTAAGFNNVRVEVLAHQWPDNPMDVYNNEGEASFIEKGLQKNAISPFGGCEYQLRVVAMLDAKSI